jgi:hypothetical protein
VKWLNRDLITGPYLGLATTEAEFHKALRHCKVPADKWPKWVSEGANATTHTMGNAQGYTTCIVCLRPDKDCTPIQIAAVLVHEAVHVWQEHCERIGEDRPSPEFEAYSIQAISQRLMQAYADSLSQ